MIDLKVQKKLAEILKYETKCISNNQSYVIYPKNVNLHYRWFLKSVDKIRFRTLECGSSIHFLYTSKAKINPRELIVTLKFANYFS